MGLLQKENLEPQKISEGASQLRQVKLEFRR